MGFRAYLPGKLLPSLRLAHEAGFEIEHGVKHVFEARARHNSGSEEMKTIHGGFVTIGVEHFRESREARIPVFSDSGSIEHSEIPLSITVVGAPPHETKAESFELSNAEPRAGEEVLYLTEGFTRKEGNVRLPPLPQGDDGLYHREEARVGARVEKRLNMLDFMENLSISDHGKYGEELSTLTVFSLCLNASLFTLWVRRVGYERWKVWGMEGVLSAIISIN